MRLHMSTSEARRSLLRLSRSSGSMLPTSLPIVRYTEYGT